MRVPLGSLVLLAAVVVPAAGQAAVSAGITVGVARFNAMHTEDVLTALVQVRPRSWLSLSAIPSLVRVSDSVSGSTVSHTGPGDIPLVVAADHTLPGGWSPTIGAALITTLPVGSTSCGLGTGTVAFGVDGGVEVAPTEQLRFSVSASRGLGGIASQSALDAPHATALRIEGAYDVSSRWTASVALGADVGTADSTQALSRVIGAGAAYRIAGPLDVTLDASRGLTSASPRWVFSLGFGTAFAGTSPVSPTSSLRRLKSGFAGGVSRPRGGKSSGSC